MTNFIRATALFGVVVFALAACGGGGDSGSSGQTGGSTTTAQAPAAAQAGTASVKGRTTYAGIDPVQSRIKMSADPYCDQQNAEPVFEESILVGPDSSLENVFVYVKIGMEGKTFPTPNVPVVFDQHNCTYHPHVFGIQTQQELQIKNSDATLHNVHATPKNSPEFNVGMPTKDMSISKKFKKSEVMVHIKCEVHPWMSAYAGVLDHPYFTVAGHGGAWELPKLPPGTYTVEAWHEKLGTLTQEVTIADGETKEVTFQFAGGLRTP